MSGCAGWDFREDPVGAFGAGLWTAAGRMWFHVQVRQSNLAQQCACFFVRVPGTESPLLPTEGLLTMWEDKQVQYTWLVLNGQ